MATLKYLFASRPALKSKGGMHLGKKKEGKIAKAFRMHKDGVSIKDIAKQMKISVWTARAYVWRGKNPQAYRELLARYRQKKKSKQSSSRPEANQSENGSEKKA